MRMTGEGGGEFPHEAGIGGTQFGRLAQPGAVDTAMQRKPAAGLAQLIALASKPVPQSQA